jgi:hypothetical protein
MCKEIADGKIEVVRKAAEFANEVQDAVNLYAITNAFLGHVKALREAGAYGDAINNHPVTLAFIGKLNSLCRMTHERECAAYDACRRIAEGELVEYDVIPL